MPQIAGAGLSEKSETLVHSTTVAIGENAVLILGASGAGKSSLALQLMSLGAGLVSDDQTLIELRGNLLWAHKPPSLPKLIEAYGIGLLPAQTVKSCSIALAIDLDRMQTDRLPIADTISVLGQRITVWRKVDAPHFPAAIFHYLSSMPAQALNT